MKILVVDDHGLIRQAMQGILKKLRRDAVVIEASNSAAAIQAVEKNPDIQLILLDLTLPDRDGFSVLAELRLSHPAIAIVVLSAVQDPVQVMKALELGVLGYIPKSADSEVMLNALRLILSGGVYVPPEILKHLGMSHATSNRPESEHPLISPSEFGLTARQMDVLALVMQGKNNKTICRVLDIAEPTVKNHITAILKALNVANRTEAVIAVNQLGWKLPKLESQNSNHS